MDVPDVTEAELGVLRRLWETREATIRQLTEHLYPGGGTAHYATVQKLLERLEAKGCVKRRSGQAAHRFSAVLGREEILGGRLKAVADKFCEGSWTPLLTHLIKARKLTARDIEELRAVIERSDKGAARPRSTPRAD